MSLKKVVACVKRYKNFLITSHTNLEGDALGSELALCRMLKKLGKGASIINEDDLPYGYDFLPDKFYIRKFKKNMKTVKFDCFVVLDSSDLKRSGEVYRMNVDNKTVLNIDHHISNRMFGNINWVDPHCSSCSEMIYKLYKKLRVPFDRDSALFLYVGMLTDTGGFRYSNTSSSTHKAVAELLGYGLNVTQIYKSIYENVPLKDMRLLIRLLPHMRIMAGGRVIWFQIGSNILENKRRPCDLTENLLGFARAIKGVEAVALFRENSGSKDEVRINLRSEGKIDVNKIAQFFGGGGHRKASGATVKGKIETVRKKVLAKITEKLK